MRALWSEDRASYAGSTAEFTDCYLRPQPVNGTIPIHIGGHSEVAARRAGRIGDGFFPFGVTRNEAPALLDVVRQSAAKPDATPLRSK